MRDKHADASDRIIEQEATMYGNPESFLGQGGYAAAVSQAARRVADDRERGGDVRRDVPDAVGTESAFSPIRFLRVLDWTGDHLIAVGAWLKARPGPAGYGHN
jgi:hypothetical protein